MKIKETLLLIKIKSGNNLDKLNFLLLINMFI